MSEHHPHTDSWTHGDLCVIDCNSCGFRHLHPLPTDADLRTIYEKEFGGNVRAGFKERKAEDQQYWEMAFGRRLAVYRQLLGKLPNRAPRILDVGCGTGNLLEFFKAKGWEVFGIEPSKHFSEGLEALGIPHIAKLSSDITTMEWEEIGKFDVINMSLLLEHVRDPHGLIREMTSRAKRGGVMTIESPNDFNSLQMAAAKAHDLPRWWINRLHLNYFDFDSLERLVRSHGFRPAVRDAQFPLEMFLLFGDMYIGDGDLGRTCHLKRVKFEQTLHHLGEDGLISSLYRGFAEIGLGRAAIVHAVNES